MPHPRPTDPDAEDHLPAPIAVFLPDPHAPAQTTSEPSHDWHQLPGRHLVHLLVTYTRPGDLVADVDNHPTVAAAARHLGRRPTPLTTNTAACRPAHDTGHPSCSARRGSVRLLTAALPRPDCGDLAGLTGSLRDWRALLVPGGFLVTALTLDDPDTAAPARSTVVAAARAAGLRYHQHLLVIQVAPPGGEPRAETGTAACTRPRLLGGHHVRTHVDVLAFVADKETTDAAH